MSSLENALNYVTHHIEPIIQWLFLATLLLGSYPIYRWVFGKREDDGPAMATTAASVTLADGGDIQVFLKKILDQTTKLETMPLAALTPSTAGEIDAQIQVMKKELAARDEELGKLKAGGDKKPSADADGLSTRIKELESKLAEYEILEDDIADLSLYKEENQRLKAELEKSKAAGPVLTSPAPGEDIVAEFANAVGQEAVAEAKPKQMEIKETGDPMADFESAVALEKKMTGGDPSAPAPPAAAPPAAAPPSPFFPSSKPASPEPIDPHAPPKEGDDLFAEFAAPPADGEDGSLDTDKMMAEMAALVNVDGAAPAAGSGLEEASDIEKMAFEATSLTKS